MPWFDRVNETDLAGKQTMFSKKLHELSINNFSKVRAKVRYNGEWRKCVVEGKEVLVDLQSKINALPKELGDDLVDYIMQSEANLALFKQTDIQDDLIEAYLQLKKTDVQIPNCK